MKKVERKATSYCGLYCGDCIPSNKELFSLIEKLDSILQEIEFSKYAEFKAKRSDEFLKYDDFIEVLHEIKKLQCEPQCYDGPCSKLGCTTNCAIRVCVVSRKYEGCWECENYKKCSKLDKHKEFHPGLEYNLDTINKYGIKDWINKRGKHYKW